MRPLSSPAASASRHPPRRAVGSGWGAELADVEEVAGGVQATLAVTFEVKAQPKPVCVAELVCCYLD